MKEPKSSDDLLHSLFPDISEAEFLALRETLPGLYRTMWRIYERLLRERPEVIDELLKNRNSKGKVDSS